MNCSTVRCLVRASLSQQELNDVQKAEFRTEEQLQEHLQTLSDEMEKDKGIPIIDYCFRVEDRKKKVLFQYFGYQANCRTSYMGIPVCSLFLPSPLDEELMAFLRAGSRSTSLVTCKR